MPLTTDQKVQFDLNMPTIMATELPEEHVEFIMACCRCAFWEGYLLAQQEAFDGTVGAFQESVQI